MAALGKILGFGFPRFSAWGFVFRAAGDPSCGLLCAYGLRTGWSLKTKRPSMTFLKNKPRNRTPQKSFAISHTSSKIDTHHLQSPSMKPPKIALLQATHYVHPTHLHGQSEARRRGTHTVGSWVIGSIGLYRDPRTGTQYIGTWASRDRHQNFGDATRKFARLFASNQADISPCARSKHRAKQKP